LGVVWPPLKGLETKNKKKVWVSGVASDWITLKGLGGGSATPRSAVWGGRNHPQALGSGPATPKRPRNQKQKKKVWILGVAGSPPKALSHPHIGRMGWSKPPPKPLTFFFYFGLLGVARHPIGQRRPTL
jgi:hypothetical protein